MKRWNRALAALGGGVFCVAVLSLYRLLELSDRTTPPELSRLQQKIDRLERLLGDNNRLVAAVRDSLLHRRPEASWEKTGGGGANGSSVHLPPQREAPAGCQIAGKMTDEEGGVKLLDVYELLAFDNPDGGAWKQGFPISYRGDEWAEQQLEVFVVPHSHNDPGWLKTFDGYYGDQTRHILDNMLLKLSQDPRRRMIWSEVSFFARWWSDIDEQKRDAVRRLLGAGQLEMVSGGWVMPDEANTHYPALLEQLLLGHTWLHTHLGVKPRSGWAVDPFGHSPTMAYLLKGAGLSAMLVQRVHYAVKKQFARQQTLEFLWRQSWGIFLLLNVFCFFYFIFIFIFINFFV
uniref:Mannosidase alpha class 2A member 1 n=1 Tax=Myripristis murdjan TaxID=586833 RepID=A0A667Y555_9TELE